MKKTQLSLIFVFISSFYTSTSSLANEKNHESHHVTAQQNITLNNGEKWSIDSSLHTGMTQIRNSVGNNLTAIHYKKFTDMQYITLAAKINTHLSYLFENCKLPSNADTQLHVLLSTIMQGTKKMESTNKQRQGAIKIMKALETYPVFFNDVNWQAISH